LDALESCLQRMEQGESLDSILTRYPRLAVQLQPLLETAARARSARVETLPLTVLARQRAHGLALAADLRQGKKKRAPAHRLSWRPAMTVLSVIALLAMSSNGLLIASAHSIPGDTLYPLKRSVESTQLHLVSGETEREALEHTFDERRIDETRSLITHQRIENVDFSGMVSSQSKDKWLVAGIPVVITVHTEIDEDILVGDDVVVNGATNVAGGVDAARLTLVKNLTTSPTHPVLTPTPTPSPQSSVETEGNDTQPESSVTPDHSGVGENQSGEGNDQTSEKSNENHYSSETTHSSQTNSDGAEEHQTSAHE
jgi:hypothetical protein